MKEPQSAQKDTPVCQQTVDALLRSRDSSNQQREYPQAIERVTRQGSIGVALSALSDRLRATLGLQLIKGISMGLWA
jgi:hypothetical protein